MTRSTHTLPTLLAATALALGGCVITTDDGATVETRGWTVNGQPATAQNCDLFEVGDVLLELEDVFDGRIYDVAFDCAEGQRALVVDDFLPVGDYAVFWSALDQLDGSVVDTVRVTPDVSVLSRRDVIRLQEPLLSRPRFEITWGAAGLSCFEARLDNVDLELVPVPGSGGRRVGPVNVDCSDEGYLFSNVAAGDYTLRVDGFDGALRVYAADCTDVRIPTTQGTLRCDFIPQI